MKRLFTALFVAIVITGLIPGLVLGQVETLGKQTPPADGLSSVQTDGVTDALVEGALSGKFPAGVESGEALKRLMTEYKNDPRVQSLLGPSPSVVPDKSGAASAEKKKKEEEDDQVPAVPPAFKEPKPDLPIFGHQIFQRSSGSFTPPSNVPVSADYLVGPDDNIILMLSGRINERHTLVVNGDGSIYLPKIGTLQVAGMTFRELQALIRKKVEAIIGVEASVTMGALRSVSVFVLGAAARPGAYRVSGFDTLLNALLYAGGPEVVYPSLRGSMRNIELKRADKVVTTLDVYDLILKGDKTRDVRLKAGDVIFIPAPGPTVAVTGEVRFPAIYELKGERDLEAVLNLAGGLKPSAFGGQVQVQRYHENRERIVLDTSLDGLRRRNVPFTLNDGDMVKVFPIVKEDANAIFLFGNVLRPGRYAFVEGTRVSDVIKTFDSLMPETNMDYAVVKRYVSPSSLQNLVPFHLGQALLNQGSEQNLNLCPGDEIYVFNMWAFKEVPVASINGEVRNPGKYQIGDGARIKDLLLLSGNLTRDASMGMGELVRVDRGKRFTTLYFNVTGALADDPLHNLLVKDQDRIIVHSIWSQVEVKRAHIDGEVRNPGGYQYTENMTVRDLVFKAGNLLPSAYLSSAEITSMVINEQREPLTTRRLVDLEKALAGDPQHNVLLAPRDRLMVRRIPGWHEERFAFVEGEVRFPGRYSFKKGERLSSLLERAGGYTEDAYLRGTVFTRKSIKEFQQKNLEGMIRRLEQDLFQQGAREVATSISKEAVDARKVEMEQQAAFIKSLRGLNATGRMQIKLAHLRLLKNSTYDIAMEDGDRISIPTRQDVVHVVGSVMTPGSYVFRPDMDIDGYIDSAGGISKYADKSNIYVMKVDGSARKAESSVINWNGFKSRWELAAFGESPNELDPGDTIMVPEEFYKVAWLRDIKDITQVIMQIMVTAAVTIKLF